MYIVYYPIPYNNISQNVGIHITYIENVKVRNEFSCAKICRNNLDIFYITSLREGEGSKALVAGPLKK